jgi:hypothetical protein
MANRRALVLSSGAVAEMPAADALNALGLPLWVKLTGSDYTNSTVTLSSVTGLSFTALASTIYMVEALLTLQSAAVTTGLGLALTIPSGTVIGGWWHATATQGDTGGEQTATGAVAVFSSGVRAAATNVLVMARWLVSVGVTGGTIQLQAASEVASSAITLKGAGLSALGYRVI